MPRRTTFISALALAIAVPWASTQVHATTTPPDATESTDETTDDATYLAERFGIELPAEVDQDGFTAALTTLVGSVDMPAEIDLDGFTGVEAVLRSLYSADLDGLARVVSPDAVSAAVADVPAATGLEAPRQQELAAAITSGLVDSTALAVFDLAAPVSADLGTYLLVRTLEVTGDGRRPTGLVSDADIYERLTETWESFDQVESPELQDAAVQLIRDGLITGYNLKRVSSIPNFDPELTIVYGHSNITHARQLIALLRTLGIDARVQLEPKTSAYLSLAEWGGEPGDTPEDQAEVLDDGNWITYAKEYDLTFEFFTTADRDRFDEIIRTSAQRIDTEGEPTWLEGSFLVPLYSARVDLGDGYEAVSNHIAWQDQFYLQSFSLADDADAVTAAFEAAFPEARREVWTDVWVNESFSAYLAENTAS